jgi:hypothetical protein
LKTIVYLAEAGALVGRLLERNVDGALGYALLAAFGGDGGPLDPKPDRSSREVGHCGGVGEAADSHIHRDRVVLVV